MDKIEGEKVSVGIGIAVIVTGVVVVVRVMDAWGVE